MSELRFGRFFNLDVKVELLFSWLEKNMHSEWSIEAKGICPVSDRLMLVAIFARQRDADAFESDFLDHQHDNGPIYQDRRSCKFDWAASDERRGGIDRRQRPLSDSDSSATRRRMDAFIRESQNQSSDPIQLTAVSAAV